MSQAISHASYALQLSSSPALQLSSSPALQLSSSPADRVRLNAIGRATNSVSLMAMVLTAFAYGCGRSASHSESKASSNPSSSIESTARTIDLGMRLANQGARFTFKVLNTSSEAFKIISTQKSCTCTEMELEIGRVINPNSLLEIPLTLTADSTGKRNGIVIIETDSSLQEYRKIQLSLTAEFPKGIWTEPQSVLFDAKEPIKPRRLRLNSTLPGFLQSFSGVTCPDFLAARLVDESSEFMEFELSLNESELSSNWAFGVAVFRFNDNRQPFYGVKVKLESTEFANLIRELGEE